MTAPTGSPPDPGVLVRARFRVVGVVQGVGFRPFVHRLATSLGLAGEVSNDAAGVLADVEGAAGSIEEFASRLVAEAPAMAHIVDVAVEHLHPVGGRTFRIAASRAGIGPRTFVPPDAAVCDDCLGELFDPTDRRYRYPFITCTNCGPRFTITLRLPYDRPNTTMAGFSLCPACAIEYHDPVDRRFHAQPLACPACGPRLWFEVGGRARRGSDAALAAAQRALSRGLTVAIKGLGGYHLACDATDDAAIARLRDRKRRPDKPFAVMVRDLSVARRTAHIDAAAAAVLSGPQRPIVLVTARTGSPLGPQVAPGSPFVGLFLPYTPAHHLLFRPVPGSHSPAPEALVMTSGNLSDEPICFEDEDARRRLAPLADAWLVHDRPIHVPCDDSVLRVDDGAELPIRRARGYAPLPVRLPMEVPPSLAVGAELKNTFCLASGRDAWMSQHIGDMGTVETLAAFERSVAQFSAMYALEPTQLIADAHPVYQTRRWAESRAGEGAAALVQHHHAHAAAVMAEHGVPAGERVIAMAFDGTGYGDDGAIWGGEVLVAGYDAFERAAHLRYVPLPGGDVTIRKPYRAALANLRAAGIAWDHDLAPVRFASAEERSVLARQLERGIGCVPTSSLGRLFDAVSSLLDVRHVVSYEAQAAIELEVLAGCDAGDTRVYVFDSADEIDAAPVLRAIVDDLAAGHTVGAIAAGFHRAVADLVVQQAESVRSRTGLDVVALTGGVWQNLVLVGLARTRLVARGFRVLTHRLVPPNDGGLALGQVLVAAARAASSGEDH